MWSASAVKTASTEHWAICKSTTWNSKLGREMTMETNHVQITWPRDLSSMSSMSSTLASQHELRAHQSSLTTQILGPASGLQHGRRTKQMPRHDQKFSLEKPFQAKGPRKVPWYLSSVAILLAQEHSTSQRSSQDTYLNTLLKTAFVLT